MRNEWTAEDELCDIINNYDVKTLIFGCSYMK